MGMKLGAYPALRDNLIGNPLIRKPEMAVRFLEGGVDNRVFDDDLLHGHPLDRRDTSSHKWIIVLKGKNRQIIVVVARQGPGVLPTRGAESLNF